MTDDDTPGTTRDQAEAAPECEHAWAWISPAGTSNSARLCVFCHQPDPDWLNGITNPDGTTRDQAIEVMRAMPELVEEDIADALADAGLLRDGGDTDDDAAEWRRKVLDVMGYDDTPEYAQELLYYLPAWKHEHDAVDEQVEELRAERDQLQDALTNARAKNADNIADREKIIRDVMADRDRAVADLAALRDAIRKLHRKNPLADLPADDPPAGLLQLRSRLHRMPGAVAVPDDPRTRRRAVMTGHTVTVEPVDLTDHDWTPRCEVLIGRPREAVEQCQHPAAFVIEVRHCAPYRLFACRWCVTDGAPWLCRACGADLPVPPVVIGEAS